MDLTQLTIEELETLKENVIKEIDEKKKQNGLVKVNLEVSCFDS